MYGMLNRILAEPAVQTVLDVVNNNKNYAENPYYYQNRLSEDDGFSVDYGETKIVILHKDWNFVLKMEYSENHNTNYCEKEADNYEAAVRDNVDSILLPTVYLTRALNGIAIFVQPKMDLCHFDWMLKNDIKINNPDSVRKYSYKFDFINPVWLSHALEIYGEDFIDKFATWLYHHDINDLHDSNLAWKDGKPVVMDYAGFLGNTYNDYSYYS